MNDYIVNIDGWQLNAVYLVKANNKGEAINMIWNLLRNDRPPTKTMLYARTLEECYMEGEIDEEIVCLQ